MEIVLAGIGKKFRKEWVFRDISLSLTTNGRYAITGPNGSGKSTLLQIIGHIATPSEGSVLYSNTQGRISSEEAPFLFSFCAPYQELIEEFSALEMLDFHFLFRKKRFAGNNLQLLGEIGLERSAHKQIKFFSSGMKQRLRLALCAFTEAQAYLLDEPTTNLDASGALWYESLLAQIPTNKTLVISSNIESEYKICQNVINIADYKRKPPSTTLQENF